MQRIQALALGGVELSSSSSSVDVKGDCDEEQQLIRREGTRDQVSIIFAALLRSCGVFVSAICNAATACVGGSSEV